MVLLVPDLGNVCSEEIIRLRNFIRDSLFTLPSVEYAYYTNVLCVYGCGCVCVCLCVCVCVCVCVHDQL